MFYGRNRKQEVEMKNKSWMVVVMLVLATTVLLSARQGWRGMRPEQGRPAQTLLAMEKFIPVRLLLKAKDKIGLNGEQEKKISALLETHEQWSIKFRADMEIKALKLRKILEADVLNMKEAEDMIRAQADMHAEMQIARLSFQQDLKALLTPEQLAKCAELKKEIRGRACENRQRRFEERQEGEN
jgi:Spy/CpxP family protein refolding chaperone